jgi:hypothetical protein
LARKRGNRPTYARVLIVCEGEKTEPLYFEEIRQRNRVPSAHVTVLPSDYGTQPLQVVNYAVDTFNKTKAFEHVFAVFDRDAHATYFNALARAAALDGTLKNDEKKAVTFAAVPSVPCFELWLLLHFADIRAYFERWAIIERLQGHLPAYAKGAENMYGATEAALADAIRRAVWLQGHSNPHAGDEAYTNVDTVVTLLRSIRVER